MSARTHKSRRKDRTLNTRISAELDRMLRAQADRLDMPVSQLVRNILSRTVNLVGDISGNVEHMVQGVVGDVAAFKEGAEDPESVGRAIERLAESVVGWQSLVLTRPTVCALTGRMMDPGEKANLGIRSDGRPSVVVSEEALNQMLNHAARQHPWIPVRLQQSVVCVRTGKKLQPGETAYFHPESSPPEFISEDAYQALGLADNGTTLT